MTGSLALRMDGGGATRLVLPRSRIAVGSTRDVHLVRQVQVCVTSGSRIRGLRAVACLLSISAASATTLTSATRPPSEEGVGYASELRALVMEQTAAIVVFAVANML